MKNMTLRTEAQAFLSGGRNLDNIKTYLEFFLKGLDGFTVSIKEHDRSVEVRVDRPEIGYPFTILFKVINNEGFPKIQNTSRHITISAFHHYESVMSGIIVAQIKQRMKGASKERFVEAIVQSYVASDIDIRRKKILGIIPGGKKYDAREGKDFILLTSNPNCKIVPLQVKSSRAAQKEHKKNFPDVPSVVVFKKQKAEKVLEKLFKIIEAFFQGRILHL